MECPIAAQGDHTQKHQNLVGVEAAERVAKKRVTAPCLHAGQSDWALSSPAEACLFWVPGNVPKKRTWKMYLEST